MRALLRVNVADGMCAAGHILCLRLGRARRLALKNNLPVRRSRLLAVNGKGNLHTARIPLDVDREIIVVRELQILVRTRNRRIHRGLHIADDHGMTEALINSQLCADNRVIKRR